MSGAVKRGAIEFAAMGLALSARVTTNAMVLYQERVGETFNAGLVAISGNPDDMLRLRNLFWAILQDGEGLTVVQVGDVMDDIGVAEAMEIIGRAAQAAFPAPDPEPVPDPVDEAGNAKGARVRAQPKVPATT